MTYRVLWPMMRWPEGREIEIASMGEIGQAEFCNAFAEVTEEQWANCETSLARCRGLRHIPGMPDNNDTFPNPQTQFPVRLADGSRHEGTVFLKAVLSHPRIEVGDYTYASSFHPPKDWAARLAPHLYEYSPEHLSIGKFF